MLPSLKDIDPKLQLLDLDRADCEDSLYDFYKGAWRYIDPSPWADSWAVDAMCEHLQAVVDGEIKQLIINCVPRIGKSSLTSVTFPAWTWAQSFRSHTSGPGVRFLHASYNDKLSLRDSVKCRRLLDSIWYRERWGKRFTLTSDQNTKSRFTNEHGGERLITSIGAGVTGEGGDIIIIDDPQSANEISSDASIQEVIDWWSSVMPTRRNNLEKSAVIIIQQRLAENDLTGHVLETEADGWTHLCLPGRYETDRAMVTSIGWKDPRTKEGELLWPERFSEEALLNLEKRMGPYVFAGQIQQRPSPAGGGIIERAWWRLWPTDTFPKMDFVLGCLDTAYTEDQINDPSGMMVWGVFSEAAPEQADSIVSSGRGRMLGDNTPIPLYTGDSRVAPKVILVNAWEKRLKLHDLVMEVNEKCNNWKVDLLLIENKASGISVAQEMRRLFRNSRFGVQLFDPKSQDKTSRLISVQHLFAEGLIFAMSEKYPWVEMVIKQIEQYPKSRHDEFVDLTSMGLRYLRDTGIICRVVELQAQVESMKTYPGKGAAPLYPC